MEAIALGKPVVMGPHFGNFRAVVDELRDSGGLVVTDHPMDQIAEWLANPDAAGEVASRGLEAMARRRGAAARTADGLLAVLGPG